MFKKIYNRLKINYQLARKETKKKKLYKLYKECDKEFQSDTDIEINNLKIESNNSKQYENLIESDKMKTLNNNSLREFEIQCENFANRSSKSLILTLNKYVKSVYQFYVRVYRINSEDRIHYIKHDFQMNIMMTKINDFKVIDKIIIDFSHFSFIDSGYEIESFDISRFEYTFKNVIKEMIFKQQDLNKEIK